MKRIYAACLKLFIISALFFPAENCFSQSQNNLSPARQIIEIEKAVNTNHNLLETQQKLQVLKQQALKKHDDVLYARCLYNLMHLRDKLTQDTMFFRNSAFLDTLLAGPASPKLKAILHIMQAQRISAFDHGYRRFKTSAYQTKDLITNYAALNQNSRDSIAVADINAAAKYAGNDIDAKELLWLSSNPDVFLFPPVFKDIVLTERINLAIQKPRVYNPDQSILSSWLPLSSNAFRQKLDSLSKADSNDALSSYQPWLAFHKSNAGRSAFIESLIHKYIYAQVMQDSVSRNQYVGYLQKCIALDYPEVKAHAVYQLCLILNEEGNRYPHITPYLNFALRFKPENQFKLVEALKLYEQHKAAISKYALFSKVLDQMVLQIKQRSLRIQMTDKNIPGNPIKIKASYKNTDSLFYQVIKVGITEKFDTDRIFATNELLKKQPVARGNFALPLPADYNTHAAYLKLDGLPAGHYRLLFGGRPVKSGNTELYNIPFEVTAIATLNTDEKVFVLDRKTGLPLAGANVTVFAKKDKDLPIASYTANKQGFIDINTGKADSLSIVYKGDTSTHLININSSWQNWDIYDGEDDEDLTDFYTENIRTEVFTDRGIYRPGQTVHYKIIFTTKNPDNNARIVFNEENLGKKIYKRLMQQLADDHDSKIWLTDPFGKKIDSAAVTINEFGSLSGKFIIPKTAATGSWEIESGQDDGDNRGHFDVEEYKRPTIELALEKPKKLLLPGQEFSVKFKLRSLNGADLGNIPVSYTIYRQGQIQTARDFIKKIPGQYKNEKLVDKTGYTDNKGELLITITDTTLAKAHLIDSVVNYYTYAISADATDATGEKTSIEDRVSITSNPVKINIRAQVVYDRSLINTIPISTFNDLEGTLTKPLNVKIYKVNTLDQGYTGDGNFVDQWYYNKADWYKWFPDMENASAPPQQQVLLLDTVIQTDANASLKLDKNKFTVGFYKIEAVTNDGNRTLGRYTNTFKVFDSKTNEIPSADINYIPTFNNAKPGDVLTWYTASKTDNYTIYQVLYTSTSGKNKGGIGNVYQTFAEKAGLRIWKYTVPLDATGELHIDAISIRDNEIKKLTKSIFIAPKVSPAPEIIIEKYRKVMLPGSQQSFSISIKTKNDKVAAELMTTMYDASLDKLNKHNWNIPPTDAPRNSFYTHWDYSLTQFLDAGLQGSQPPLNASSLFKSHAEGNQIFTALEGRVSGLSVADSRGLNEVVVVGYGSSSNRSFAYSTTQVRIRGNSSLNEYNQPFVVVDGVIHPGGISGIDPARVTNVMVLKGAEGAALYGSRAANGVLIVSTKGPIILPNEPEPVAKVRKNFNETAFFFPKIYAGADGYYSFSFTVPETATEWNWKMLAHTKKSQFAYLERKLQTQLALMVQPNMPRLLYQGDKIKLQSRITNLDTVAIQGKITCKIEDAVTGDDLTTAIAANAGQPFSIGKKTSGAAAFALSIPKGQLNPLKIVITATGPGIADAEEHIIPVMDTRVFVKQSQRVIFAGQPSLSVKPVNLPANADLFGFVLSINPKPQASIINALPWLANYSYDCAEQTFNKLRANTTALLLMRKDTFAQKAYAKAAALTLGDTVNYSPLPDELAEAAMPWLNAGNNTMKQQKQLFNLLDTAKSSQTITKYLDRLYSLQQPDGGLAWFDGGRSNTYISAYVLAGFGQLKQSGWDAANQPKQQNFIQRLMSYNQAILSARPVVTDELYQLYALSYWKTGPQADLASSLLNKYWQQTDKLSLQSQALLIINTLRYTGAGSTLYAKALNQLESIKQMAISDEANGIRWKAIADGEEMNASEEETMALLAEAFNLSGKYSTMQTGVVKWLLTAKQDQHWQTTKGTAAAINMLQKEKGSSLGAAKSISTQVNGHELTVSDDLLSGNTSAFVAANKLPNQINLQQSNTSAAGNLTWYYFADAANLDTLNKSIKLKKQFYSFDANKGWLPLTDTTSLKPGDRVQVKLTIETASRLKFVHINDPRAAAFEPKENNSGYRYNSDFGYYQSVRDTGLDLFAEAMPRGKSEIIYELVVAHSGQFASGPAKLQCMYAPALAGYSNGNQVSIK